MRDWVAYVEHRLQEWAEWALQKNAYGLGYPSCSLEYRLWREGGIRASQGVPPLMPTHPAAEEMEALICEMGQQNSLLAKALYCHYCVTGTLRTHAHHLNISYSHFRYSVAMAHQWLAGRLSANKQSRMT